MIDRETMLCSEDGHALGCPCKAGGDVELVVEFGPPWDLPAPRSWGPPAPKDVKRERVIAERDGSGWLVMWPDGNVDRFPTAKATLRAIQCRIGEADMLVTTIEWRS